MSLPSGSSAIGTIATVDTGVAAPYVGRFAPSPTGPMHFGSLVAALASYLEAHARGGRWLLRIEDIDPPRERPGAADRIVRTLDAYGFEWDGPVTYQSKNRDAQHDAVRCLVASGRAYPCGCSRRDLANVPRGRLGTIYPGTCRDGFSGTVHAIRVRTDSAHVGFADGLQGDCVQHLASESGDFVILRRDGLIAYHLAVVVDDHLQGITEIIRGIDLLDSTPRQIWLQRLLGYVTPAYSHIPIVVNADGDKLSKNTGAPAIPPDSIRRVLVEALAALLQNPPAGLAEESLSDIWDWALTNWNVRALKGQTSLPAPHSAMAHGENGLR